MNKFFTLFSIIVLSFSNFLFAGQEDLVFKGGHTVQVIDTLFIPADSSIVISDFLKGWSPFLNNIDYMSALYSNREKAPDGSLRFFGYLSGVRFFEGKYATEPLQGGVLECKILFTENYNNYKVRIDCKIPTAGEFFLVTSAKGMNSNSEYFEKYSCWIIKTTKPALEFADNKIKENNEAAKPLPDLKTKENPAGEPFSEIKNAAPVNVEKENTKSDSIEETVKHDESKLVTANVGASFASRFFWRGQDFSKSPVLLPSLSVGYWGFKLEINGVYSLDEKIKQKDELVEFSRLDFGISYTTYSDICKITAGLTDYYFPFTATKFFTVDGKGKGAHTPEINLTLTDVFDYPVRLFGAVNVFNDPDDSFYLEAAYCMNFKNFKVDLFAGGTKGPSVWYNAKTWAVVNLGFSIEKDCIVSENYKIPLTVSYFLNTYSEENCLVFKISF